MVSIKGYGNIPIVLPDGNIRHIHNVMFVPDKKESDLCLYDC